MGANVNKEGKRDDAPENERTRDDCEGMMAGWKLGTFLGRQSTGPMQTVRRTDGED